MPASYYSPFLEDCKDVYDKICQDFKAMLDRLETCETDMMQLIINEVNPKINRGRLIVYFVFTVYAKHRAQEGAIRYSDIIKALPPIDLEFSCLSRLDMSPDSKAVFPCWYLIWEPTLIVLSNIQKSPKYPMLWTCYGRYNNLSDHHLIWW